MEDLNQHISLNNLIILLKTAFEKKSYDIMSKIPKTDLHTHGLLSAPFDCYQRLAKGYIPPPPNHFNDFKEFNTYIIRELRPIIQANGLNGIRRLIKAGLERTASEGVIYSEMSFDISAMAALDIPIDEFFNIIDEETKLIYPKLWVSPEIGLNRAQNPVDMFRYIEKAVGSGIFKSIDLYGDEDIKISKGFIDIFNFVQSHGLKVKAHVGETGDADSIKKTVCSLNLDSVQHGITAVSSPDIINFLAKKNIVLNMCPASNYKLGLIKKIEEHPLHDLFKKGIRITINTDDFTLFNASICDQLFNLKWEMGLKSKEIAQIIRYGLDEIPVRPTAC